MMRSFFADINLKVFNVQPVEIMKRAFYVPVFAILGFLLLSIQSNATEAYPSNWFVNMKYNKVQVLLRSADADFSKATIAINYPGVKSKKYIILKMDIISQWI